MNQKIFSIHTYTTAIGGFIQQSRLWLKAKARKHWIVSTLLLMWLTWHAAMWVVFTPIRNPWPKDAYTVKGRFPFEKGFDFVMAQSNYGTAPWFEKFCGGGIFYLLGYTTMPATCGGGYIELKPKRVDGMHYEVTAYRDEYFKGPQQWSESVVHSVRVFKTGLGLEEKWSLFDGLPEPQIICDDIETFYGRVKGEVTCIGRLNPKKPTETIKYKKLQQPLPLSGQDGPNVEIFDFWLESEIDEILKNQPTTPNRP